MHLAEIEAFLAVTRAGSFVKAAEQLFITQPTLSHRIQSLEKELGSQLLMRSKGQRRVELTEAGHRFVLIAEKWVQLWHESKQLTEITQLPAFRVSATQTLSTYVMPSVYAKFAARKLPILFEMYSLHYQECYKAVEDRTVDAVFVSRTIASNKVSAIPVASEKMVLLCGKNSSYTEPIHPSNLPKDKEVYMLWNHEYAMWHEYWFGGRQYPIYADSMQLAEKIMAQSDYWAIVPISAAQEVVQHNDLHYFPLLDPPPDRSIFLLTLEPQHPYTSYIVEDLRSTMAAFQ